VSVMRVEARKLSSGEQYFSFVYWDGEKRVRLKKDECPHFDSREKAETWAKAKEAEVNSAKSRVIRRLQWKTQFYEFSKISDTYIEYCKKTQPNSWKNTAFYLEQYVLPFFLEVKKSNNPNNWSLHFEDFKAWLEDDAFTIKKNRVLISYSTKNHCIKTLNTFLDFLKRQNMVDPVSVYKVTGFSANKVGSRDASSLISEEEFKSVHGHLKELNPLVATFFETAFWTGMRFNEIYGLSMDDIIAGELDDNVLKPALDHHGIKYYGYIVLESQPATKIRARLKNGTIIRKPLKGKPKIATKYNRLVPIISKELFNNLVKLYKIQEEKFKNKVYGTDPKNYVLFEQITHSETVVDLRAAYAKTNYTQKSYHCCRHTRCTELVGKTRDFVLARYWLGHARQETTLRYTHIYQQSANTARKKAQKIDFVE
jgi:integrase